jgi:hypothetical protein
MYRPAVQWLTVFQSCLSTQLYTANMSTLTPTPSLQELDLTVSVPLTTPSIKIDIKYGTAASWMRAAFNTISIIWGFKITTIPEMIEVCKACPEVEKFLGVNYFNCINAHDYGDLGCFLYVINEHPPLAQYVHTINFSSFLDSPDKGGVYEMLLDTFEEDHATSKVLRHLSEEFFLVSFGDVADVPDWIHFEAICVLLQVASEICVISMPQSWIGKLNLRNTFKQLWYVAGPYPEGCSGPMTDPRAAFRLTLLYRHIMTV